MGRVLCLLRRHTWSEIKTDEAGPAPAGAGQRSLIRSSAISVQVIPSPSRVARKRPLMPLPGALTRRRAGRLGVPLMLVRCGLPAG